ncbi:MAG: AbrB/MazE/SpoVT family DNA-binding domain-containing protein [Candidatus Aenigmarchaeota archaeon]|nr:AbrB/MazE/SpoVT family DNA-binding domain-containing protein [Candidatus Aenigmarchaeota archaeon]
MKIEEKYTKVGERGQIVIPKSMRDSEHIKPNQILRIKNIPGAIIIEKPSIVKSPEEKILETLTKIKVKFTEKDWEQVHKEREER